MIQKLTKILLIEEILYQLRMVVYPIISDGFYTSNRWLFGISEPSTICHKWLTPPWMKETIALEEVQSDSHHCDVALRKIVSRALTGIPKVSCIQNFGERGFLSVFMFLS